VHRRIGLRPHFERGEAVGRLLCLYARLARVAATA
jgi:hypothetical protein